MRAPPARLAGGPAPVGAYLEDALGQVVAGDLDPGKVFDRTVGFDGIPDGYAAMDSRESLKVMVSPDTEPTSTSH